MSLTFCLKKNVIKSLKNKEFNNVAQCNTRFPSGIPTHPSAPPPTHPLADYYPPNMGLHWVCHLHFSESQSRSKLPTIHRLCTESSDVRTGTRTPLGDFRRHLPNIECSDLLEAYLVSCMKCMTKKDCYFAVTFCKSFPWKRHVYDVIYKYLY